MLGVLVDRLNNDHVRQSARRLQILSYYYHAVNAMLDLNDHGTVVCLAYRYGLAHAPTTVLSHAVP
jgi:hypothetical protein